jgi:PAS domain S-box-containing protein
LHLEDNRNDAELIESLILDAGIPCTFSVVETRDEFIAALDAGGIDLIISDYSLPSFDGMSALSIARQQAPDAPFVFVSGTLGEESAIQSMVGGATDYVLKTRLTRLVPAIRRALREAEERHGLKQAEQKLRESEQLFRLITENAADLIVVLDLEGRRLYNSPSYEDFFGTPESMRGSDSFQEVHPEDRERVRRVFRETVETGAGSRTEYRFLLKDGSVHYIESQGSVIRDERGKPVKVVVVSRDITARKEAERALSDSEARYRELIESARDAIYTMSPSGVLTSLNSAFERITGWQRDAWVGKTFLDLLHPDDRPVALANFKRVVQGESSLMNEYRIRRESGGYVLGEITATPHLRGGKVVEVLGVARDITERRALEDGLRQAQKMESLGTLAGGIAHDFNNILSIIMGHASLLEAVTGESPAIRQSIESITKASTRGASLVRQLLTFARKGETQIQPALLNDTIREVTQLLAKTLPKTVTVSTHLDDSLPVVLADTSQIHQVLLNLCVNARDAMPSGGTLTIASGMADVAEVRTKYAKANAGRYVQIEVADTGEGMDAATVSRIFEPFFTTKEAGKGTGLGLAVVFGIMNTHGGFIDVRSARGNGTTFRLWFPVPDVAHGAGTGSEDEGTGLAIKGGSETILVVEDEEMLMELATSVLTSHGYNVVTAADGRKALEVFARVRPDLVMSDFGLPQLGGRELFAELRSINPAVKVIFASGYMDPELKGELLRAGAKDFIQKPYVPGEILQRIRQALDH